MAGRRRPWTRLVEVPGLEEQRVQLFQAAFDHYLADGKWPVLKILMRELVDRFDAEEVAEGLEYPWVEHRAGKNNPLELRVAAIAKCRGSEEIVRGFLAALKLAHRIYITPRAEAHLTQAALVKELGVSNEVAHHVMLLFKSENLHDGLQGSVPGDMVITVPAQARKYGNLTSLEEYLRLAYPDTGFSLGTRRDDSVVDEPQPAGTVPSTAFVMLWLAPDNPDRDTVAQAIREAFAAYGVRAEHAMDVDHDGVITELILRKLREAEYLVADLTGARPSVYYEVGYAHALGKRTMLVRKMGTPIHFDLALHNAPEYRDAADLKRLMLQRLNERIGPLPQAPPSA